jgi:hypothetical protein
MALEEFENREEDKKRPGADANGTRHYIMGALWVLMGAYLLAPGRLGYAYSHGRDSLVMGFGAVSVVYGSYRIYRGYKKQD